MTDQVVRNDGVLLNALTGLGTNADSTIYTQVTSVHRLGQAQLDQLCQVWPLNVACTAFPDSATAKGWSISWPEGTSGKIKQDFDKYRSVIGTRTKDSDLRDQAISSDAEIIRWAGYLANVYRGAAIVLNIDDGRRPDEPVDTKNIKTIREIEVLDSFQIYPDPTKVANPLKAQHFHLQIAPDWHPGLRGMYDRGGLSRVNGYYTYPIHRSRIIRVPGVPVPPQVMRYNNGWDRSLLEVVWDQYTAWESVTKATQHLVKDYSLFVYKLSGFADMMTEGNEAAIRTRVQSLSLMASIMGGVCLDNDQESVEFVQRSFAGLNDLMSQFRDMLIGATGIPHTILFGESPSGLGATGEAEEKTWAKKVDAYQNGWVLAALNRMYQLIFLAKDGPTGGKPLEGWSIAFNPLLEQTEAEKIANRASQAQTDNVYVQMGALVPEEIRQSRFGGPEYSLETTLDDDAFKKAQEQPAADPAAGAAPADPAGVPVDGEVPAPAGPPPELAPEEMSLEELQGMRGDSARADSETGDRFSDKDLHAQALREAKSKFKIWPSAYGSGWLTKRYKSLYRSKHGGLENAFTR